MAEHAQSLPGSESDDEDNFYRMLEEYTQQVRLRYNLPVRLNLPRAATMSKGSNKVRFGNK